MTLFYVQADGDTFIRHIHDVAPTRWDENNFCRVANLTPKQIVKFGVHPLQLVTPPYFDPATQMRVEVDAVLIGGVWTQAYSVTGLDPEAAKAKADAQWLIIREQRDAKLVASDWTQLPDVPVDAVAWGEYRQALRDVTDQADPFNIVWPTAPGA